MLPWKPLGSSRLPHGARPRAADSMQINRGTEYAIRAATFLALHAERTPILVAEIAAGIGAPQNYLSNILQALTRFQIVRPHRGARRGYSLAAPPAEIDLLQIVEALEGPLAIDCCSTCDADGCPLEGACLVTEVFAELEETIREKLSSTTLDRSSRSARRPRRSARAGGASRSPSTRRKRA